MSLGILFDLFDKFLGGFDEYLGFENVVSIVHPSDSLPLLSLIAHRLHSFSEVNWHSGCSSISRMSSVFKIPSPLGRISTCDRQRKFLLMHF